MERRGRPRHLLDPQLVEVLDHLWAVERERSDRTQADGDVLLLLDTRIVLDDDRDPDRVGVPVG